MFRRGVRTDERLGHVERRFGVTDCVATISPLSRLG
jgi:hypothetical protein